MASSPLIASGTRVRATLHAEARYRGREGVVIRDSITEPGKVWVLFNERPMPIKVWAWELVKI